MRVFYLDKIKTFRTAALYLNSSQHVSSCEVLQVISALNRHVNSSHISIYYASEVQDMDDTLGLHNQKTKKIACRVCNGEFVTPMILGLILKFYVTRKACDLRTLYPP